MNTVVKQAIEKAESESRSFQKVKDELNDLKSKRQSLPPGINEAELVAEL